MARHPLPCPLPQFHGEHAWPQSALWLQAGPHWGQEVMVNMIFALLMWSGHHPGWRVAVAMRWGWRGRGLGKAQDTMGRKQHLRTHLKEVEPHGSSGSKPSEHAPLSHLTSLTKHRFKGKIIKNFKTTTTEHYLPHMGSFWVGALCGVSALFTHPESHWLNAVYLMIKNMDLGIRLPRFKSQSTV